MYLFKEQHIKYGETIIYSYCLYSVLTRELIVFLISCIECYMFDIINIYILYIYENYLIIFWLLVFLLIIFTFSPYRGHSRVSRGTLGTYCSKHFLSTLTSEYRRRRCSHVQIEIIEICVWHIAVLEYSLYFLNKRLVKHEKLFEWASVVPEISRRTKQTLLLYNNNIVLDLCEISYHPISLIKFVTKQICL